MSKKIFIFLVSGLVVILGYSIALAAGPSLESGKNLTIPTGSSIIFSGAPIRYLDRSTYDGNAATASALAANGANCAAGYYPLGVDASGAAESCTLASTGGLTGSGTANYMSKWTGTSALGNSIVFDNGTNVGVGITSPTQKLDVAGSIKATGYIIVPSGIVPAVTGAPDGKIFSPSGDYVSGTSWGINYNEGSPDYIEFNNGTSATSKIALDNGGAIFGLAGGNVGIGTTIPNAPLTIAPGGTSGGQITFRADRTDSAIFESGYSMNMKSANGLNFDYDANLNGAGAFNVYEGATSRFYIAQGGNIGVGATSPDAKLDVYGSTVNSNGNFTHYQDLASYSASPETGTKVITLPKGWTNTMMSVTIKGYDYSGAGSWEVIVGGYNYAPTPGWYNTSVEIRGKAPFNTVRLGYNGSKMVILLGTTSTSWQYPKLEVSDFYAGYSDVTGWGSGWTITNVTSESGISYLVNPIPAIYTNINGNVGINNINPTGKLDVVTTGNTRAINATSNDANGTAVYGTALGTYGVGVYGQGNDDGVVGLGNVVGVAGVCSNTGCTGVYGQSADGYAGSFNGKGKFSSSVEATSFIYTSDRSLKKNIKTLDSSLNKILQLRGVSFDWKKDNKASIGLIAQEVEKVYPDLVSINDEGTKSVQYGNLVAPLIEAIKEQQKKIDQLETRITILEMNK